MLLPRHARRFVLAIAIAVTAGPLASAAQPDLIDASNAGDVARVKALLAANADVEARGDGDTTALMFAARSGSLEIVQALLGHKSIGTTEKHYAPWVKSRQEMLIREVMRTW